MFPLTLSSWFWSPGENSASYLKIQAGKTFSYDGHALVTLQLRYGTSNFYALTGEFMRKIYAASWNLFNLTAEAGRVLCQLVMLLTVFFPLHVQREIQLLSTIFCYSWLACLLGFWLRNVSLFKVGNLISDGIVFVFHLALCVRGYESLKRLWPYLIAFRSCISNGKPE